MENETDAVTLPHQMPAVKRRGRPAKVADPALEQPVPDQGKMFSVKMHRGYWPVGSDPLDFDAKIQADDVVDLPEGEAKRVVDELGIGELANRDWHSKSRTS